MENDIPRAEPDPSQSLPSVATRSVDRALEGRRAAYADEVQRLVQAGFAVIRDTGRLEPTVGEIVRAAGLSNKAFYRHFRSKDELLLAVLDDGIRQLCGYLRHRMASVDTPLGRVRAWLDGTLEQALDRASAAATRPFALSRARLSDLFAAEVAESERQLTAMLEAAIREAAASGALGAPARGRRPERDAEIVYGLAMGWLERKLGEPQPPQREDAQRLVDFCVRGLGGAPDAPARASSAPPAPVSGT